MVSIKDIGADPVNSVVYASEIQKGLLPKARHFKKTGIDYGILYEPHSILAGDFYWLGIKEKTFFFAVADCTGKGVPASLLSVMGISLLNYIILGKNFEKTGDYLKELDKKWIETFQSENENHLFNNDWMEIALLKVDVSNKTIEFAGAELKAIIRKSNGELHTTKTNHYPIGGWQIEKDRTYSSYIYEYEQGDEVYLFTDGITDQFGGNRNKKFGIKNLKELITQSFEDSISEKINYIKETINLWKGSYPQTDDMTLIGLKF